MALPITPAATLSGARVVNRPLPERRLLASSARCAQLLVGSGVQTEAHLIGTGQPAYGALVDQLDSVRLERVLCLRTRAAESVVDVSN